MSSTEKSTLLPKPNEAKKTFYFLNNQGSETKQNQVVDIPEVDEAPPQSSGVLSFFQNLFSKPSDGYQPIGSKPKTRMVPVKVEPKVFFANERTFLAWLHMSVTLASISVAIVAFAEASEWSQIYGILLMPVAIAFSVYSLYMYTHRAQMIRRKAPGPYEDRYGPFVLSVLLGSAILINFIIKLYHLSTKQGRNTATTTATSTSTF